MRQQALICSARGEETLHGRVVERWVGKIDATGKTDYSDERYWPLYEILLQRKAVAVFHTGYLGFSGTEPEIPPIEMADMRAAHIDAVARRFPTLKIVMAHFSNPWWEEAWKVSWSNPNVYADQYPHANEYAHKHSHSHGNLYPNPSGYNYGCAYYACN